MFLVTGLGNPGKEYEYTPHNAGFMFLDTLRDFLMSIKGIDVSEWVNEDKLFLSEICKIKKDGELIGMLQRPLTYMNLSGNAVRLLTNKYDINNFMLVHDDLDVMLGKYKIQEKSPKGHNGVLSVENMLKRTDFLRLRIGIENRDNKNIPGEDYVIRPYTEKELETLNRVNIEAREEVLKLILN